MSGKDEDNLLGPYFKDPENQQAGKQPVIEDWVRALDCPSEADIEHLMYLDRHPRLIESLTQINRLPDNMVDVVKMELQKRREMGEKPGDLLGGGM